MKISSIHIQNFRKLKQTRIDFSEDTTLFVGANNSGKTTAMDALGKFLAGRRFNFNDFTITNRSLIDSIGNRWVTNDNEMPGNLEEWENILPQMDVWIEVSDTEIHYVTDIIPTLKWRGGILGVRLIFQPQELTELYLDYREEYLLARETENSGMQTDSSSIKLFPTSLCEFLNKKLNNYFTIKSYILDPSKILELSLQRTQYEMECFTSNPLREIIKIDIIDAQRGFTDPDNTIENIKYKNQLSTQMRSYYDRHLDPEKLPAPEDIEILRVIEEAKNVFDKTLSDKFSPAIKELEELGYPGLSDPRITISTTVNTTETLNHDSAIQYSLSRNDATLKLPEKYNGLGYQNLISMVFNLMSFRDSWMRVGKVQKRQQIIEDFIEPLHLVLVEEPEAHLHMQVQQVFIRKAYSVLRNHAKLGNNNDFSTQLIISTHSSHIARETNFANLRYFKRITESEEWDVGTAQVVNLSDVFGTGNKTDKFVTRYLQATHCDLFFADVAILVEGSAENMLLPHFIRNSYPELHQRYITILSINGRHAQRLEPLISKLCLPTLVISDLDSAEKEGNQKASRPIRCKGLISGNSAITKWFTNENNLDKLLDLAAEEKEIIINDPFDYAIRIAYQTPVTINYKGKEIQALSSTFEDCLIYTNYDLFDNLNENDAKGLIKKVNHLMKESNTFDELHKELYEALRNGRSNQKAEFALDLIYTFDPSQFNIPLYIKEGLDWVQQLLRPVEGYM